MAIFVDFSLEGGGVGAGFPNDRNATQTTYSGRTVPVLHRSSLLSWKLRCFQVTMRFA